MIMVPVVFGFLFHSSWIGALIGFSIFAILESIIPYVLIKRYHIARASRGWPYVEGVITQSESNVWHEEGDIYYSYNVHGQDYTARKVFFHSTLDWVRSNDPMHPWNLAYWKNSDKYSKGNRVNVYYHPNNPQMACLEPGPISYRGNVKEPIGLKSFLGIVYIYQSFFGLIVLIGGLSLIAILAVACVLLLMLIGIL